MSSITTKEEAKDDEDLLNFDKFIEELFASPKEIKKSAQATFKRKNPSRKSITKLIKDSSH